MADATELGIVPPATVRIEYDDTYRDYPFEVVEVLGDRIQIAVQVAHHHTLNGYDFDWVVEERGVLHYPYEHAHEQPDGSWRFLGGAHPEFFIRPGPPQALAMDTAGPQ